MPVESAPDPVSAPPFRPPATAGCFLTNCMGATRAEGGVNTRGNGSARGLDRLHWDDQTRTGGCDDPLPDPLLPVPAARRRARAGEVVRRRRAAGGRAAAAREARRAIRQRTGVEPGREVPPLGRRRCDEGL